MFEATSYTKQPVLKVAQHHADPRQSVREETEPCLEPIDKVATGKQRLLLSQSARRFVPHGNQLSLLGSNIENENQINNIYVSVTCKLIYSFSV